MTENLAVIVAANMGLKDLPLTAGLPERQSIVAGGDCDIALKLRAAGAALIGQALVDEAGFDAGGHNPHYPSLENPIWPDIAIGGASSGIAHAVASGTADLGLGIDTLGDVRVPAALTGLTGFKPGRSLLSTEGCVPTSFTLDSVGMVARSVDEAFAGLAALLGVPMDPTRLPDSVEGLRLAVPWKMIQPRTSPEILQAFETAVGTLSDGGANILDAGLDQLDLDAIVEATRNICATEAAEYYGHLLHEGDGGMSADLAGRLREGMTLSDQDRLKLATTIVAASESIGEALVGYDALLTPTVGFAPTNNDPHDPAIAAFTVLASLTGTPAICQPFNPAVPGSSIQILGDSLQERKIVTIARWLESRLAG